MLSVSELIARGRVPSSTIPAQNRAGYPDGWPIFQDLSAQVKYDWDYLPSDRVRNLKSDPAYKTALETMLTGTAPAAPAGDGGASEIPAATPVLGGGLEEQILAANEPVAQPVAEEPVAEPVVPEPPVPASAGPAEDEVGTRYETEYGYTLRTSDGWEVHVTMDEGGEQIYRARTQKELIAALMKAQAHATAKIRAQEQEKEEALANAEPDIAPARKRLSPRALTADEQFEFAEEMNSRDPLRMNKAMAKRDAIILGGPVQEVIAQVNETIDYQELETYKAVAKAFLRQNSNIAFNKELTDKLDAIINENEWAYTVRNLNKALALLKQQGAVSEKVSTPSAEPVLPVPTGAAAQPVTPAKPAVQPAPAKPAAVATNQPAAAAPAKQEARLRPGSASTGISPRQASVRAGVAPITKPVGLTAEEYNRMSVSDTRHKYKTDPGFRSAVDQLIAEGKI